MNENTSAPEDSETPDPSAQTQADARAGAPYPQAQPGYASLGFFDWLRSLNIHREPGWLGGVAAGIAHRLVIDVALVRGVLVVIAILGFPVLFAYGIAWLLLPDTSGKIHLEELLRGNLEMPLLGIGITILLGASAFGRGIWPAFSGFNFHLFGGFWSTLWAFIVIGIVIAAIYFISRQYWGPQVQSTQHATFVAPAAGPADTVPPTTFGAAQSAYYATHAGAYPAAPESAAPLRPEPIAPQQPVNATPDQMSSWQAQHQAWRAEHAQWRVEQNQQKEAWRQARRAESQERRRIQQVEQRIRMEEFRARNPRVPGAVVLMVIGLALIVGALFSSIVSEHEVVTGIAASSLTFALAMVVASLFGRRTASMGLFSAIGIVLVLIGSFFPTVGSGHSLPLGPSELSYRSAQPEPYLSAAGNVEISLAGLPESWNGESEIVLNQAVGQVRIYLPTDRKIAVNVNVGVGSIRVRDLPGEVGPWANSSGSVNGFGIQKEILTGNTDEPIDFTITVRQGAGNVYIIPLKDPKALDSPQAKELTLPIELSSVEN